MGSQRSCVTTLFCYCGGCVVLQGRPPRLSQDLSTLGAPFPIPGQVEGRTCKRLERCTVTGQELHPRHKVVVRVWNEIAAKLLPRRQELLSPQTPRRRLLRFCCHRQHTQKKNASSKCQANKKSQAADSKGWGKCKRTVICRPRKKKSVVRREGGRRGKAREGTDQQRERRCNTTQQSAL